MEVTSNSKPIAAWSVMGKSNAAPNHSAPFTQEINQMLHLMAKSPPDLRGMGKIFNECAHNNGIVSLTQLWAALLNDTRINRGKLALMYDHSVWTETITSAKIHKDKRPGPIYPILSRASMDVIETLRAKLTWQKTSIIIPNQKFNEDVVDVYVSEIYNRLVNQQASDPNVQFAAQVFYWFYNNQNNEENVKKLWNKLLPKKPAINDPLLNSLAQIYDQYIINGRNSIGWPVSSANALGDILFEQRKALIRSQAGPIPITNKSISWYAWQISRPGGDIANKNVADLRGHLMVLAGLLADTWAGTSNIQVGTPPRPKWKSDPWGEVQKQLAGPYPYLNKALYKIYKQPTQALRDAYTGYFNAALKSINANCSNVEDVFKQFNWHYK